ncbi:hypothetical protein T07_14493 [Trichinella nelsoni]|uniref:Uncharacterized protein n=1 Tax=Trichinella nelsoni TaxID=6336 RepID=A0A0V0RDU9_9BILA|nr:hypothetical protein T07_14493 [Trichinella nelsoni]
MYSNIECNVSLHHQWQSFFWPTLSSIVGAFSVVSVVFRAMFSQFSCRSMGQRETFIAERCRSFKAFGPNGTTGTTGPFASDSPYRFQTFTRSSTS